ncbi:MAG: rod-binding protein [Sphingomonadaceae bacterium]|nr:rod-binding protein [Sphingomonadaceae bacterium]
MIAKLTPNAQAAAAATDPAQANSAKLKSAAQAFEAVFLRQMIGSMREASLGDGIFDSDASKQFQDMADSKTADAMAQHGVLGIAQMLEKQLAHAAGAVEDGAKAGAANQAADNATFALNTATSAAGFTLPSTSEPAS